MLQYGARTLNEGGFQVSLKSFFLKDINLYVDIDFVLACYDIFELGASKISVYSISSLSWRSNNWMFSWFSQCSQD